MPDTFVHHRKDVLCRYSLALWACCSCRKLFLFRIRMDCSQDTVCSCLLFHGGRMALGATVLFFPFTFPHGDLSRYKYAKAKWIREGLDPGLWWIKAQQETLTQCLANCVILACPFYILCSDPTPHLRLFEVIGLAFWALSSLYENIADTQKLAFLALAKIGTSEQKTAMKTGVLGMPPFDGPLYKLWTFSRHPNYCGEFGCWVGFALTALPSIFGWIAMKQGHTVAAVLLFNSWLVIRFFYDCLVHWTGAGPAEQASIQKRPEYKIYQKSTPVLFPFRIPFLSSHQVSGWPNAIENPKSD
ncbi:hypothetical protein BCR33DRAFT_132316 [Rhizoclosmatium globosum]|uniref:DUF1295-domain-containing protein n=1 Tax=Rhizoclosmatium globosum TaxID=329046 RepID=A0A1Y2CHU7_9FUNG|nr:hypothetical protein BCR33DRAFT_132316 [Rhizoclosmatium globosum]|eukprot:ORY46618.1 hypothetical protein BCR33DRAFT_132316 [Rhizoclosmatium globosum]